jgi:hypothetical protein
MCENCSNAMDTRQQVEFLRRYLDEQQSRLELETGDPEIRSEVEKTRHLLAELEAAGHGETS